MHKHRTIAGIPAAEILKLQPGDILALSFTHAVSDAEVERVSAQLRDTVPNGVTSVIIDRNARFQIIRTSKDETS